MEEKCIGTIKNLCKKYEGNAYMLQRIDSHINTYLESTLQNEEQPVNKRHWQFFFLEFNRREKL